LQLCGSLSETGGDDLHGQWYTRPATLLKSKVWLYCIKFCHAARRRGSPIWRPDFPIEAIPQPPSPIFGKDSVIIGLDLNIP
jgi:hypothetical protein